LSLFEKGPVLLAGSTNHALALAVAEGLRRELGQLTILHFPDGELHVEIDDSIRERDVYLLQSTSPPVGEHLLELLLLADASRRAGAHRVTAVMPYFGYARQDRRATGREPVSARLVADVLQVSGINRVVAIDLHVASLEGFFVVPVEHLSAQSLLAETVRPWVRPDSVVIAPDLGAAKLAERYASQLGLPVAVVHKTRLSGEDVRAERIVGEVRGRAPIIVDDMISTGGTIEAAAKALVAAGCRPEVIVATTHALLVGRAVERLAGLPLLRLIATDTVGRGPEPTLSIDTVSVGLLLADTIDRLHHGRSLADLMAHA
jgi:ribose-phosphate pyrophosphokinase